MTMINREGNRFAILIFLTSSIPRDNPIIRMPPTAVISLIMSVVIQSFIKNAF